ncbi:MAG TPA: glycerol-3-phosphate 1-O-acyltransferase PlsY [Micavibrio sp.]|nr:glycerol-3-phosphate 1-O-acyltransferase PlsY [Micavibrio sp.]
MDFLIAAIGGYLLGSIPFGLVLTKLAGYGDIRAIGSGNIGATNVLRTGNKKLALATLILDGVKGIVAVLIAHFVLSLLPPSCAAVSCVADAPCDCSNLTANPLLYLYVTGFFAIIGHIFPVWLKFKGGKGVATTLGTLLILQPVVGAASCAIWLATAFTTRYSSLSALIAIAAAPAISYVFVKDADFTGLCGVVATLVFFKHRANIARLMKGEEPRIGTKKS